MPGVFRRTCSRGSEAGSAPRADIGIDVGARVEVYRFLKELAEAGAAVLIISSDMPEVLNMSHRLYVVRDGRIADEMDKKDIDEARALRGFFGAEEVDNQECIQGARHE